MRVLYLVSVWLHILAATVWVGGMAFLVLVLVPWLRRAGPELAGPLLRDTGRRFRGVGWLALGVLVSTGTFNLWVRGVRVSDFLRPEWRASPFGETLLLKLALFASVVVVSAIHDFRIGPRASTVCVREPHSPEARALRRTASRLGRLNGLLALGLVALGVCLVRGLPW